MIRRLSAFRKHLGESLQQTIQHDTPVGGDNCICTSVRKGASLLLSFRTQHRRYRVATTLMCVISATGIVRSTVRTAKRVLAAAGLLGGVPRSKMIQQDRPPVCSGATAAAILLRCSSPPLELSWRLLSALEPLLAALGSFSAVGCLLAALGTQLVALGAHWVVSAGVCAAVFS